MSSLQMLLRSFGLAVGLLAGLSGMPAHGADTTLRIGGTGAAIGQMTKLAEAFAEEQQGIAVEVLPSLGSGGGIRALADGVIDIAVSARPLKTEEAAKDLETVPLSRSPVAIVSSYPTPLPIAAGDFARFYADPKAKWPDGSLVRIILRPASDSDSATLRRHFDGMEQALAQARRRSDVPVATTDQQNVALAAQVTGSLTIASLSQIVSEQASLTLMLLDGVAPSLENLESDRYPLYKEITVVLRNDRAAAVDAFMAFIATDRGRQILRACGSLPLL